MSTKTRTTIYAKCYSDHTVKLFCRPCLARSGGMTPGWFVSCLETPMHGVCCNADYPDCADVCESLKDTGAKAECVKTKGGAQ